MQLMMHLQLILILSLEPKQITKPTIQLFTFAEGCFVDVDGDQLEVIWQCKPMVTCFRL